MTQTILLGTLGIIAVLLLAFISTFFFEIKTGLINAINKRIENYRNSKHWNDSMKEVKHIELVKGKRSIYYDVTGNDSDPGYLIEAGPTVIEPIYEHD